MENILIITNEKQERIKEYRKKNPFSNIKFFTELEFVNSYPYYVEKEALDYIMDNYKVILEVARIYLENIQKYNIEKSNHPSLIFLKQLKKELIEKKLIKENILLKEYLKHTHIIFENINFPKYLIEKTKNLSNVTFTKKEDKNYTPEVFILNNIEEEIAFVGEQIIKLIQKGIPKEKIFISNIPPNYITPLKRIMNQMNIPITIEEKTTLKETTLATKIIDNLDNIEEYLKTISNEITTKDDNDLLEQIITIINKHFSSFHQNEWIKYELKQTKKKQTTITNSIKEINFKTKEWHNDEYCFIMSFNNEEIPLTYKNEEYIKDDVLKSLNIETSKEKNQIEKKETIKAIQRIQNCIITFKKNTLQKECYPSSLLEDLKVEIKKGQLTYTVSKKYNEYTLGTLLDNYQKYGTITNELILLYNNYFIPYQTYNNEYTKINQNKLLEKLYPVLNLSYTKLDTYNKCAFSYYIKYILKIIPYEDTFSIKIGKIIHKILEEEENENFDYDKIFEEEKQNYTFNTKELFFIDQLKESFRFTINTIKERKKFTLLNDSLKEMELSTPIENIIPTTFNGIIDNLMYNKEKIISIIDYKTGTPILDQTKMPLGFSLQLPTYLYLLKKDKYFKNSILGGFYLQPLFPGINDIEKNSTYEQTQKKKLKKIGYSNQDKKILEIVDQTYQDSIQIKGLKTKSDGNFYQYAKLLNEENINELIKIVDNKIKETTKNITDGNFSINPKIIDNIENIACEYCPLSDICYHKPKDNIYLTSDKKFLKKEEESHGMDERTTISN